MCPATAAVCFLHFVVALISVGHQIESGSVYIYHAPTEEKALEALGRVTEKWSEKYPNSMKSWKQNWDAISPIFKFSADV